LKVMDTIEKDIKKMEQEIEKRRLHIVGAKLDECLLKVESIGGQINEIIENTSRLTTLYKLLSDVVSACLVKATDGCIAVPNYVQKQMAKQQVQVFVGTHWVVVNMQIFYDWVKDAAYRCGLGSLYCEDYKFMGQLFEAVAFRVSRYREQYVPKGKVWINLMNGTLELGTDRSIVFRAHDKEDFFTYVLPYDYKPEAQCPLWHKFLDRVVPDKELQLLLGEYIGYCFTKDLRLEKALILEGPGGNGKSVFSELMIRILGDNNVSKVDWEPLTNDETYRAVAVGKLANISQENGQNVKHSILKSMISGEDVMTRQLYKDPVPTHDYGKLVALFNTMPKSESTQAYARRLLIVPFHVTITDEERDVQLIDKLTAEQSGILNWVLTCLQCLLIRKTFVNSKVCEEEVQKYVRDQNSALRFFDERCVIDIEGKLTAKELYAEYLNYCRDECIKNQFGKNGFLKAMTLTGVSNRKSMGIVYYSVKFKSSLD